MLPRDEFQELQMRQNVFTARAPPRTPLVELTAFS